MTALTPFESLYESNAEASLEVPLPFVLSDLYGSLRFPTRIQRPYRIANFVETLDGVVSLGIPGHSGGGEISGFNLHDRLLMGLLRAVSDAVIVGAGTLRSVPTHVWTANYVFPDLSVPFQALRAALGKVEPPLNVIVTAQGELDLGLRVFSSGEAPVLIVTTQKGWERLADQRLPPSVRIAKPKTDADQVTAQEVLNACIDHVYPCERVLVEGGPHLIGDFFAEKCLDELFLTFSPQVAGRDDPAKRAALVAGKTFAPEEPLWGTLAGVKRAGNHLFLRYRFNEPTSS
jgi:riboflavin biosynthesis pyrimidine reductase